VLQDRLVRDVAGQLDARAWSSTGDAVSVPRGVLAAADVAGFAKIDLTGDPVTFDVLHDAYGQALSDDIPLSGLKWVMSPSMLTSLRKIKTATTSNEYVVADNLADGPAGHRLLRVPVTLTKRMAASDDQDVLLWSPSMWGVARDLSPTVVLDKSRYLEYDQIALRIVAQFD
jgi:HK97 family phage major capsid protein